MWRNGKVEDLRHEINEDCELVIHTFQDDDLEGKKAYWHTTSHIMAQAIKRLYGNVKLTIGPAIENGFYYDFDTEKHFSEEDFEKIEEEMKKIIKEDLPIERFSLPKAEAIELMKDEPYKVELINELPEGEEISFYKQGEFTDLCAGPHLMSTGKVKCIKLLSSSGAYWRGDEHNKMLQRIYAISFPKASMMEEYMVKLEDAKNRDHRKIGKELELFMTHELVGSALPMYLPNGATVRRILERYIQDKEIAMGYKHVYTPSMANVALYKTSGHWDHYKEDMFPVMKMDNEEMVLRPMNCPHHMLIYKNKMHSYRDLPIRIGELAHDFRYENSGAVCGLERVREMCQNDAHLFVRPDQIKEEFGKVVQLILSVYKDFGFTDFIDKFDFPKNVKRVREYISDEANVDRIISEYEKNRKKTDQPFYMYNMTIQNHSPYDKDAANFKQPIKIESSKYDAEANRYLNLIKYSDDSLKQLTSYFEKCKEPTIILFLGDHQPRLTDEFMNKITNGQYQTWSSEQMMKRYQVPFVIWANYDIKEQHIEKTSMNYIQSILTKTAGVKMTGYQRFLNEVRKEVPTITSQGYWGKNGKFYQINDKGSPYYGIIQKYRMIQYNMMFDKKNRRDSFFEVSK